MTTIEQMQGAMQTMVRRLESLEQALASANAATTVASQTAVEHGSFDYDLNALDGVVEDSMMILVDGGASAAACPIDHAPVIVTRDVARNIKFRAANGAKVDHIGEKTVDYSSGDATISIEYQFADVKKPILALSSLVSKGFEVLFSQYGSKIMRGGVELELIADRGQYWLRVDRMTSAEHIEYLMDVEMVPEVAAAALPADEDRVPPSAELPLEAREPIIRKAPDNPSPDEKAKHEAIHLPYRSWCPVCIAAKGRDNRHGPREK